MGGLDFPLPNLVAVIVGALVLALGALFGLSWRITVPLTAVLMLLGFHLAGYLQQR